MPVALGINVQDRESQVPTDKNIILIVRLGLEDAAKDTAFVLVFKHFGNVMFAPWRV